MTLRVGYVNVQGLSPDTWNAACSLLHTHLDYLFLAETWYVNHQRHIRDRRLIASTQLDRPGGPDRPGRPKGGIYLLGTHDARTRIHATPKVTEHAISFTVGKQIISGAYFPPSMPPLKLQQELASLRHSTILIGDINTRFADRDHQDGQPGPPERIAVFSSFLQSNHFSHLKPFVDQHPRQILLPRLTVDHCFLRGAVNKARLRLLSNESLRLKTDHKYTMHLTICNQPAKPTTAVALPRYRISRLSQSEVENDVIKRFNLVISRDASLWTTTDVDELDRKLVRFCQDASETVLGRINPDPTRSESRASNPSHDDQTIYGSVRLYKKAVADSGENAVIQPTESARARGITALTENYDVLKARYTDESPSHHQAPAHPQSLSVEPFTKDQIVDEINRQDGTKSCGADGIHIRLLKVLVDTALIDALHHLFRRCLTTGTTPLAWNETEIHLLAKDPSKPRDAKNLRPITLICVFRKIFEKLLLTRFDTQGWARLHPAQAGFRSHYSTCTNAAVVHHLLASRLRTTAVFLDFRSAFDVLNHPRLSKILVDRACPDYIQSLIGSLMFQDVKSRVLVNGIASDWFLRTRGVLQGSPISPYLFNLFVDDLVETLNQTMNDGLPHCLFYADDGILLALDHAHMQSLLNILFQWSTENNLHLNVAKCGHLSQLEDPPALYIDNKKISNVQSYTYLGFPMTPRGIDFNTHLEQRFSAALKRANWLSLYSDAWGPAHRLRIYKQYLAPMFEYGAPLVCAWLDASPANKASFYQATRKFKDLIAWVGHCTPSRYNIIANLCGLPSSEARFRHLRTAYQWVLEQSHPDNPLKRILGSITLRPIHRFAWNLRIDQPWKEFKRLADFTPTVPKALRRYLSKLRRSTVLREAQNAHLTALVPFDSRKVPGLSLADNSLAAPIASQELLFQYRRGTFLHGFICLCGNRFHRGHESCPTLPRPVRLTRAEISAKLKAAATILATCSPADAKFTDVDFLLNSGELRKADTILSTLQRALAHRFHESMFSDDSP